MAENNWCVVGVEGGGGKKKVRSPRLSDRIELSKSHPFDQRSWRRSFESDKYVRFSPIVAEILHCKITNDKLFLKVEETED